MVIQLSSLSFAHQDEALAYAIMQAAEKIAQKSGNQSGIIPDYISLLGTIRACQQQTVAFRWLLLYQSVEHKLLSSLENSPHKAQFKQGESKKSKVEVHIKTKPESFGNRCLPFTALQALLMWLHALQSLPEDRFLHLKCESGISTVVVWCHHILGLDMTVSIQGVNVRFGEKSGNIFVEDSNNQGSDATLMDPADQQQPLFTMDPQSTESIRMVSESRAEAFGYGRKILDRANFSEEDIQYCANWITAQSIAASTDSSPELYISKYDFLRAGGFLFGLDRLDIDSVEFCVGKPPSKKKFMKESKRSALIAMVQIFARIHEQDLEKCRTMPLSLSSSHQLRGDEGILQGIILSENMISRIDVLTSFQILSYLLLGHMFTREYVRPAALVSAWGWSIFFDSVHALDPEDVPTSTFRVMCGVPSRSGLRRSRIIDGPKARPLPDQGRENICKTPPISLCPGISTARRGAVLIGNTSDAFQVQVILEWTSKAYGKRKHRNGFREMQELCLAIRKLPPCQCDRPASDIKTWIGERACYAPDGGNKFGPPAKDFFFEVKYPRDLSVDVSQPERVYTKAMLSRLSPLPEDGDQDSDIHAYQTAVWIFHVSSNPVARWLQLDDFSRSYSARFFNIAFKGQDTCFECSTTAYDTKDFGVGTMILMAQTGN